MSHPKRKIQIYPSISGLHTAWKSQISQPPEGYEFIGSDESSTHKFFQKARNSDFLKVLYRLYLKLFKSTSIVDLATKSRTLEEAQLVLSMGTLYYGEKPWIMDILDIPYCMTGNKRELFERNKEKIEANLSQDNCKAIVCEHESSVRILKKYFSPEVIKKIKLIYPAVKPIAFKQNKKYNKKTFRILFMGSINNPDDFYMKGGYETIKTFQHLQEKYDNIELIIRCKTPEDVKKEITNNNKIILMDNEITFEELIKLYLGSDILLLPSHTYVLMSVLESMYFKLPIVAIDTYAVRDHIQDKKTGFIVKKSEKLQAYNDPTYPNNLRDKKFFDEVKNVDPDLINRLATKVELLLNNPSLRRKMGEQGHKLATTKFSIKKRNDSWKKLFDKVLN